MLTTTGTRTVPRRGMQGRKAGTGIGTTVEHVEAPSDLAAGRANGETHKTTDDDAITAVTLENRQASR